MALGKSTAVGAFVLGGIALGVAAILLFGGTRLFSTNLVRASFSPILQLLETPRLST